MEYLSQENLQQIKTYLEAYSKDIVLWITPPLILISISIFYDYKNKLFSSLIPLNKLTKKNYSNQTVKINLFFYWQIAFLVIFSGIYIYLILYGEEFAYHDNEQFTYYSLDGRFFGMPIWKNVGRYWPLGLQEYNIISLFSKTIFAYHLFSIAQLLITIPIIYLILRPLNITSKLVVILIIMVTPSFAISFFGLIFPERNLIFWLAIFIYCYQRFIDNKSISYFCLIILATQFLLYYKEPMFLLIGGFASSRLSFQLLINKIYNKPQLYRKFIQKNWCDLSLIILSIIFLIQYLRVMRAGVKSSYADNFSKISQFSTLIHYFKADLILLTFLVVFSVRILFLLVNKKLPDLIWDSLAIGSFLYFCAYVKLSMFRWYYMAPVDFIATLYLAKLIFPIIVSKHKYKILGIIMLVTAIFIQNLHHYSYAILERKKSIEARVEIVNFLERYISVEMNNDDIHLFLPAVDGYNVMQLSSFLYYKNFSVLPEKKIDNQKRNLIIYTDKKYPKNLCRPYRPFKCYYTDNSKQTDLTIILPTSPGAFFSNPRLKNRENKKLRKTIEEFEDKSIKVYHYQPKFEGLEQIMFFFATKNLIDNEWLNAYLFVNKKN